MPLPPVELANLRQTALSWAVSTATDGEAKESVLERAKAYLDFILAPYAGDEPRVKAWWEDREHQKFDLEPVFHKARN